MALTDAEREQLRSMLERMPDSILSLTRQGAERLLHDLEDANSMFPATKEFLTARGLTNIRELDEQGREELLTHLKKTLRLSRN